MKQILFCLTFLFCFHLSAQKVVKDSIVTRNDSIFTLKYQVIYEHVPDTMDLHERYMQIEGIVAEFRKEQELIRSKIEFFEENNPMEFLQTKKQPARKPKKKKQ